MAGQRDSLSPPRLRHFGDEVRGSSMIPSPREHMSNPRGRRTDVMSSTSASILVSLPPERSSTTWAPLSQLSGSVYSQHTEPLTRVDLSRQQRQLPSLDL